MIDFDFEKEKSFTIKNKAPSEMAFMRTSRSCGTTKKKKMK